MACRNLDVAEKAVLDYGSGLVGWEIVVQVPVLLVLKWPSDYDGVVVAKGGISHFVSRRALLSTLGQWSVEQRAFPGTACCDKPGLGEYVRGNDLNQVVRRDIIGGRTEVIDLRDNAGVDSIRSRDTNA